MIERVADEHNLNLPLPPEDFAVVLSALSDGLLVHWLSDPKAVPNDLFARFIIASVIAPSASQTS